MSGLFWSKFSRAASAKLKAGLKRLLKQIMFKKYALRTFWPAIISILWLLSHLSVASFTAGSLKSYEGLRTAGVASLLTWLVCCAGASVLHYRKTWSNRAAWRRGCFLTVVFLSGVPWAFLCSFAVYMGWMSSLWGGIAPASLLGTLLAVKASSEDWSKP